MGEGRRGGRTTKSTTANLLVPVASPGAAPIAGSFLLRQRQAPVKFRRGGARLALRMVWHDQGGEGGGVGGRNRAGVASIYSRARGPSGRKVSSSEAMLQEANGMGKGRGRCCVSWRCSTAWSRVMGRCGLVWNGRCSARQRRRSRRRAVAVWRGALNGDVWRSPGSVVIVCARGEGGV